MTKRSVLIAAVAVAAVVGFSFDRVVSQSAIGDSSPQGAPTSPSSSDSPTVDQPTPSMPGPSVEGPVLLDKHARNLDAAAPPFLKEIAVKLRHGAEPNAVAETHGGRMVFSIGDQSRWWLVEFETAAQATSALGALLLDARVEQAIQQRAATRAKKTNDPFFGQQWHLRNTGQRGGFIPGTDLNVEQVWNGGRTGSGTLIAIVDDGVERFHPDLAGNYVGERSFDFLANDADPSPENGDDHGTACAGIAAARGENFVGLAGVAHSAGLAGLRLVGSGQSDAREGSALNFSSQNIHVYSNSWGPPDNGQYEAAGPLALAGIQNGVTAGRGGLGSIYTWAAGNGGSADWSNKDGFANLPETIAVSAINGNQLAPTYAEGGSNILVSGLAGSNNIATTDLSGVAGSNTGSSQGNLTDANYTNNFDGTSAATPMVAGVAALMLEANSALDWRSVQHIFVRTARRIRPLDSEWRTNGAGYRFHHRHGAGLVDANAAVNLALQWTGIPAQVTKFSTIDQANISIPDATPSGLVRTIDFTDTLFVEHVVVEFTSNHTFWGDLEVFLVSPSGMESKLASFVNLSTATGPTAGSWRFMTVRHWGEQANGTWTLRVNDRLSQDTGSLQSWRLVFHGTDAQVGATGGVVVPGSPTITQVTPNPVEVGSTVTVTGTNLAANPTLTVTLGGVAQVPMETSATSITFMVASGTPRGSQPLTIHNGIASTSTSLSIGGAGGGGGCMLVASMPSSSSRSSLAGAFGLLSFLTLLAFARSRRQRCAA